MRVKPKDLKVGDIICVYQERCVSKIDIEIKSVKWQRSNYGDGYDLYIIEGSIDNNPVIFREYEDVILVTVEDRIKGAEKHLMSAYDYSRKDMAELRYRAEKEVGDSDKDYLKYLQDEIGERQADAYERIGEERTYGDF